MTLLIAPPPNPWPVPPDSTGRYPFSETVIGEWWGLGKLWPHIPIFGRAGQPPDSTLTAWLRETIDGTSADTDWWTWAQPSNFGAWFDGVALEGKRFMGVSVELRTAEEVQIAGAGHGLDEVFAVTGWDGSPNFPPLDGVDDGGLTYGTGWDNMRFLRVLIRDDLASGGAGPQWSGREFFLECLIHEFGHVAMMLLTNLYGEDYVIENVCDLFGKPTSQWNDPGVSWDQRVIEAAAEFFKDVSFPKRRYNSRAAFRLPIDRFADWRHLFFDYLWAPWWGGTNTLPLRARENTFFENLGACSYVLDDDTQEVLLRPSGFYSHTDFFSLPDNAFEWPPSGTWHIHWAYDPRPISDPGFGRWDPLQDPQELIFVEVPPPGQPNGYCSPLITVSFFDTAATTSNLDDPARIHYGTFSVPIWNMGVGPPPPLGGQPFPPSSGVISVDIPPDILAAVPADAGCNAYASFEGHTLPKYAIPGDDYVWPWMDYSLLRARPEDIIVPWPYSRLTGKVRVGPGRDGNHPSRRPVSGAQVRLSQAPIAVLEIPPVTVLDGAQSLGTGTITVVTTLDLPSTGRIKVTDRRRSIVLAYTGTTPTTLTGVTYIKGDLGTYADGSHVYLSPVPDPSTT